MRNLSRPLVKLLFPVLLLAAWLPGAGAAPVLYPTLRVMPVWRALLLIYPHINVDYTDSDGTSRHLTSTMSQNDILNGLQSFQQFASTANQFSNAEALVQYEIVYVTRPINTLTSAGNNTYWLSPDDTRQELDQYAPPGTYDSIFIYWPRANSAHDQWIPSYGWGLALGPGSWSNGATYAAVHNGPDYWWGPTGSHVWLHEWLHGVCGFYSGKGYPMPAGDADGGGSHGYVDSPTTGWADYYRDLMTGRVLDNGSYKGIPPAAWRSGAILGRRQQILTDYFYADTTANYQRTGTVTWQAPTVGEQYVSLGTTVANDNKIYLPMTLQNSFTLTARLYIPASGVGIWDSVAIALRNNQVEYWAILLYGTDLPERNTLSISRNDSGVTYYPLTLTPGWYTLKVFVDYSNAVMRAKAWADGTGEPASWQTSRALDPGWTATHVGFRHYGQGTRVDDLVITQELALDNKVYMPLILR